MRLLLSILALAAGASGAAPGDAILGEWRGTSICIHQPPGSPCKDETIRYLFSANAQGAEPYHLDAQKLVGGAFETMYEMDFAWSSEDGRWTHRFDSPRCPACTWWYRLDGADLVGGLTDGSGVEVREVKASR